jgi:hypothetical protein
LLALSVVVLKARETSRDERQVDSPTRDFLDRRGSQRLGRLVLRTRLRLLKVDDTLA